MAVATRTLKDTKIATGSGTAGGKVTILITFDDETSSNTNVIDASALAGHANGAMLDITRLWWGINNGLADDDLNWAFLEFKGASSDTLAINLAGTGHYDGTAGKIENNATNTTATSGDMEASFRGASGFIIMELRKDETWTA
tara:strand:+ start:522 stop:950 length:429 start_codon:yes stop_codon:yes gene_type:complete